MFHHRALRHEELIKAVFGETGFFKNPDDFDEGSAPNFHIKAAKKNRDKATGHKVASDFIKGSGPNLHIKAAA